MPLAGLLASAVWTGLAAYGTRVVVRDYAAPLGFAPGFVDHLKLAATPMLLTVVVGFFVCWMVRDGVLLFRSTMRLRGTTWGLVSLGFPLVLLLEIGFIYPAWLMSPLVWLLATLGAVAAIITIVTTIRADVYLETTPRGFGGVAIESLLGSVAIVSQGMLLGGSSAITIALVALPYANGLLGQGELPAIAEEWLVATVFRAHWLTVLGGGIGALGWLGAALPIWLFLRFARRDRR